MERFDKSTVNYWRFHIARSFIHDCVEVFLFHVANGVSYACKFENGEISLTKVEEGSQHEPVLRLGSIEARSILEALTEGLKEAGFVAEVDNSQRISAEAVAGERKDEIAWLRKQIEDQLNQ